MSGNRFLAATLLAAGVALTAFPARAAMPISARVQHQRRLIAQYRRSGALTPREARRLWLREDRIALQAEQAGSRHPLTRQERFRLERELDRQYRLISQLAHHRWHT